MEWRDGREQHAFRRRAVGDGAIVRNSIVESGAVIHAGCVVRRLSAVGTGCVVVENDELNRGLAGIPASIWVGVLGFLTANLHASDTLCAKTIV